MSARHRGDRHGIRAGFAVFAALIVLVAGVAYGRAGLDPASAAGAPSVRIDVTGGNFDVPGGWYNATPTVTIVRDAGSSTQWRWDDSPWTATADVAAPIAPLEGAHMLSAYADGPGASPDIATADIRVDTGWPTTAPGGGGPPSLIGPQVVWIDAVDAVSGIRTVFTCLDPVAWPPTNWVASGAHWVGEGPHVLHYYAVDNAGNLSPTRQWAFTVYPVGADTQPPTTTITLSRTGWTRGDVAIAIAAKDDMTGVKTTWYRIDDGPALVLDTLHPPVATAEGPTRIEAWSEDWAGNVEQTRTATALIDRTPPTLTCDAVASYNGTATIRVSAEDTVSGLAFTAMRLDSAGWDFAAWGPTGRDIVVPGLGYHRLELVAMDVAGNSPTQVTIDFLVGLKTTILVDAVAADPPYAAPVRVAGSLTVDGEMPPGSRVLVERLSGGLWSPAAAPAPVGSDGSWAATVRPLRGATYRARPESAGLVLRSFPTFVIVPHAPLGRPAGPSLVKSYRGFTVTGSAPAGAVRVEYYKVVGGRRSYGGARRIMVPRTGRYSVRVAGLSPGTWEVVAHRIGDEAFLDTTSPPLRIVSRR